MSAKPILSAVLSYRPQAYSLEGRLRLRARQLARDSAARLRRAATRAGGDAGLALSCALLDMIDLETSPLCWPLSEMIDLLEGESTRRDRQVLRLLVRLRRIEADIDRMASQDWSAVDSPHRRAA